MKTISVLRKFDQEKSLEIASKFEHSTNPFTIYVNQTLAHAVLKFQNHLLKNIAKVLLILQKFTVIIYNVFKRCVK